MRDWQLHTVAGDPSYKCAGFRKRFRRIAGISPARYQHVLTISRACKLMLLGQMTDRDVAKAPGFCDEHSFLPRFGGASGKSWSALRAHAGSRSSPIGSEANTLKF